MTLETQRSPTIINDHQRSSTIVNTRAGPKGAKMGPHGASIGPKGAQGAQTGLKGPKHIPRARVDDR
jgi:hypothetical protein